MLAPETIALVAVTFLVGGFIKGTVGLGLPVVALAFMAAPLGLKEAMAIMLAPCIVTNIWQALVGPAFGAIVRRLWSFLLAAVIAIWFGVEVLVGTRGGVLLAVLGLVLCLYSVINFAHPRVASPGHRERFFSPLAGAFGGVMFGMTGTFIVPGILYLETLGLKRDVFVQALGITFVTITSALALSFSSHGLVARDAAAVSALALLPTIVGLALGQRYRHRISEHQFRQLFFATLFVVGLYMLGVAIF